MLPQVPARMVLCQVVPGHSWGCRGGARALGCSVGRGQEVRSLNAAVQLPAALWLWAEAPAVLLGWRVLGLVLACPPSWGLGYFCSWAERQPWAGASASRELR